MIAPIAILALAFNLPQSVASNPCAAGYTQNVWDPRFTPGQHWSYRARPIDKDSTLTINKIDYVPEIGFVVHIEVDHIDFVDRPGDRPYNNNRREYLAMRRDSLDASVLEILGISQVVGPQPFNYHLWQANCAGLTYGTTVADTLKTLNEQYLARQETFTIPFALAPDPAGKLERFTLTLSQRIVKDSFRQRELEGRISYKDGSPVKDAQVELRGYDSYQQAYRLSIKTNSEGRLPLGSIFIGRYDFKLTLDGFHPMAGTLNVSDRQSSLSNVRSGN
jgi:hypothetical protein